MQAPATSEATTCLEGFADFVGATIGEWKVPGAAVAVVKDGAVIFCQGFGLRDVGRRLEVTPHTLFPIASCTKAFTTMGLVVPDTGKYAELPAPVTYGLGWAIQPYRGHTMIHHAGGINGFSSLVTLLPHDNVGVIVLNNLGSPLPPIVTYNAIDRLLGLDDIPWSERFMKDHVEWKEGQRKGDEKGEADRVPDTQPSHPLESYTGDFVHPGYGTISVAKQDSGLIATVNSAVRPLTHYHYDIFQLTIDEWDLPIKLSFSTNVKGDIEGFAAPFEPTVADIVFKRAPNKEMSEKSFLERFTGEYDVFGMPLTVALKGDTTLMVALPGQQAYELVPHKGTEFSFKGLSAYSIEFKSDRSGAVTEALLTQPGGVFTARKKSHN